MNQVKLPIFECIPIKIRRNSAKTAQKGVLKANLGAVALWQHRAKKASVYVKITLVKQLLLERRRIHGSRRPKRKGRAMPGLFAQQIKGVTT
ncbi:hypothetical protein [Mesorhizobium sp. SEMIA 3007]|uniref:hypothetical protein n=1 Tax=Mesorhizobium sp. SEMIA 3007 TaxID=1862350 RepID=UPI00114CE1E4|nr:hypothetical protein [Mesorhizobium sp. SEMIA 3007]